LRVLDGFDSSRMIERDSKVQRTGWLPGEWMNEIEFGF